MVRSRSEGSLDPLKGSIEDSGCLQELRGKIGTELRKAR